jgi:hypothetical protein
MAGHDGTSLFQLVQTGHFRRIIYWERLAKISGSLSAKTGYLFAIWATFLLFSFLNNLLVYRIVFKCVRNGVPLFFGIEQREKRTTIRLFFEELQS